MWNWKNFNQCIFRNGERNQSEFFKELQPELMRKKKRGNFLPHNLGGYEKETKTGKDKTKGFRRGVATPQYQCSAHLHPKGRETLGDKEVHVTSRRKKHPSSERSGIATYEDLDPRANNSPPPAHLSDWDEEDQAKKDEEESETSSQPITRSPKHPHRLVQKSRRIRKS